MKLQILIEVGRVPFFYNILGFSNHSVVLFVYLVIIKTLNLMEYSIFFSQIITKIFFLRRSGLQTKTF